MKITEVKIQDFRNITQTTFVPSPSVNVLCGENGEGKTNFLEAMWLATGLGSFRGARRSELVQFEKDFLRMKVSFETSTRPQTFEMALARKENRRSVKIGGVQKKRASDLSGHFLAVVFSPLHMELVTGGPEERRRFLDTAISQIKPHYIDLMQKYQKTLLQRNHLLRKIRAENLTGYESHLAVWDESLAGFGASIMEYRYHYLETLRLRAKFYYEKISNGKEHFSFSYHASVAFAKKEGFVLRDVTDMYRTRLEEGIQRDVKLGFTSVGIHRDDLRFELAHKSAKAYASQGQKRSIVLSLKLAESDIIKESTGEEPVIFFDDIMSELDEKRSEYILNHLDGRQVFITGCDKKLFESFLGGKLFEVHAGEIKEAKRAG